MVNTKSTPAITPTNASNSAILTGGSVITPATIKSFLPLIVLFNALILCGPITVLAIAHLGAIGVLGCLVTHLLLAIISAMVGLTHPFIEPLMITIVFYLVSGKSYSVSTTMI